MSIFGDNSAILYRNVTAVTTAIFLLVLLSWAIFYTSKIPSTIGRENTTATVTKIKISTGDLTFQSVELQLPDETKFKAVINARPIPKVGDTMPVFVFLHDNNTKSYSVNQDKWRVENYLYQ